MPNGDYDWPTVLRWPLKECKAIVVFVHTSLGERKLLEKSTPSDCWSEGVCLGKRDQSEGAR